jgi:hypothetical protein
MSMTTKLQKVLMGSCLALGLGLTTQANAEELRIGYIAPVTGIFAQVGKDMVDGFQLYLSEHNNKLGGMDVTFIVEDDQGKPDAGVTKAKKLILQDKVQMFIGGLLASSGYALARAAVGFFDQVQLPGVWPVAAAAVVLIAAAVIASLMPATRASRVDVLQALRSE